MPVVTFDQAVSYYDNTRGYPTGIPAQIRDAIRQHTQAKDVTRFLELGVGTGLIALPFLEAADPYVGVDVSVPMMQQVQVKFPNQPSLIQADMTRSIPLPDNAFDVVMAIRVMHVLDNWQAAIAEARRVLHPTGYILIAHDVSLGEGGPASLVHGQWDVILEKLGISENSIRPGLWLTDEMILDHLRYTGATTQIVDLVEYQSTPLSIRMMAERHKQRWYSRDWELSEAIHAKAVKHLDYWLDHDCDNPDQQVSMPKVFRAISVHWAEQGMA